MTKVKNISDGPRGIHSTTGLVMLDKGETRDIDLAKGEEAGEWFEFGGEGSGEGGEANEPSILDSSIADLSGKLAEIDDPAEIDRLIEMETGGKSRRGALDALEARKAEIEAANG